MLLQSPRADGVSVNQREPILRSKLKKLSEIQLKPEQVLIRDKLGFFLGVVNLWYDCLQLQRGSHQMTAAYMAGLSQHGLTWLP